MHVSDWVTLLGTVLGILTAGAGAIAKLTRLVAAVEALGKTLEGIVTTIADHERRLGDMERGSDSRSRYRAPW